MVLVQVRDVEVVAVAERVPVQCAVVREREPGCEVGRIHPGVTKDAARIGLDQKSGVAYARDLHKYLSEESSDRPKLSVRCGPRPATADGNSPSASDLVRSRT